MSVEVCQIHEPTNLFDAFKGYENVFAKKCVFQKWKQFLAFWMTLPWDIGILRKLSKMTTYKHRSIFRGHIGQIMGQISRKYIKFNFVAEESIFVHDILISTPPQYSCSDPAFLGCANNPNMYMTKNAPLNLG